MGVLRSCVIAWTLAISLAVASHNVAAAAVCPEVGFNIVEPRATAETRALRTGNGQTLYLQREPLTTTSDITEVKLLTPAGGDVDDVLIQIKFTALADQRLHEATTNRSGMRIAFLFDEAVLLSVVWEGPYGMETGGTQVSIRRGMQTARRLVEALRGCTAGGK
ncbi:MAG: hypothetical protein ABI859_15765 [Pseudomonadota bacterium]